MRLGFVPEPLATLLYGSRIAPESEQESGPQALTEHRRLSSQRVNGHTHKTGLMTRFFSSQMAGQSFSASHDLTASPSAK